MNRLAKAAVLIKLGEEMKAHGSWCGQTHYQKAVFFLQSALKVELGFSYILYKYGPYSFDLRDEMESLEADGLLQSHSTMPYGCAIQPTSLSKEFLSRFPKTLGRYGGRVSATAETLGHKTVSELEKLLTALYIERVADRELSVSEVATVLHSVKPHITLEDAAKAVRECRAILKNVAITFPEDMEE